MSPSAIWACSGSLTAKPATRAQAWDADNGSPARQLAATHFLNGIHASVVLPGHGPALRMPLAEALAVLRGYATPG